jgi:hypothetical protein
MSRKRRVVAHSDAKQKEYERQARLQYGPDNVNESVRRWGSYSEARKAAIQAEGGRIYEALADALEAGLPTDSAEVNDLLAQWHQHIRHFYEPTLDILRGLGDRYNTDPEFMAFFRQYHDGLPAYLQEAIAQYVDALETAELERMLMEDAASRLGV